MREEMYYTPRGEPTEDLHEAWPAQRHLRRSRLKLTDGAEVLVSTVFLGIDHRFASEGDPILWETMIFDDDFEDLAERRYTSPSHAVNAHNDAVRAAAKGGATILEDEYFPDLYDFKTPWEA